MAGARVATAMAAAEECAIPVESGAYGLRVAGPSGLESLLVRADPIWPRLEISVRVGPISGLPERVDGNHAVLSLLGGLAEVDRDPARVVFTFAEEPSVDAIAHPYLAPIAGLLAHWHGRESLHAGAFLVGNEAWGVLAERQGGKSSTLARLAVQGVPIVTDDVLVIGEGVAFAGPRALDLRDEPARALGVGEPLGVVGTRERWRLRLGDIDGAWPLKGWIFLTWANEIGITPVSAGDRLLRLAAERTVRLVPQRPAGLLRLAGLPSYELRRPRNWTSLEEATSLLLRTIA